MGVVHSSLSLYEQVFRECLNSQRLCKWCSTFLWVFYIFDLSSSHSMVWYIIVSRGVAWIFEVVRRIVVVCDWAFTGIMPVSDAAGLARGWSGGGPPTEEFFFKDALWCYLKDKYIVISISRWCQIYERWFSQLFKAQYVRTTRLF